LQDIVQSVNLELRRGSLINDIIFQLHNVNITIDSKAQQYHRFLLVDWIYSYIFNLKSYQFKFSYSNCLFNDRDITIHNNVNNIISNFTNKILQSSLVFDKEIIISSLLSNCTSIVYISDLMKNEVKIIFYALLAFLVGLIILIISILYWKGYLNWIIYYKKSELYFLPNEVSWSLLLQLKYPYKVNMTYFKLVNI
jgi:hypothetical protein